MKLETGLRVLSKILDWDNERATAEFRWLKFVSGFKYDGYEDFVAGVRFVESLATWLQQFDSADRETAYRLVRKHVVYVGPSEMRHLVDLAFPETVRKEIGSRVAEQSGTPPWQVRSEGSKGGAFRRALRRTLFLGLSDGAHIDAFRRANAQEISNEQVVPFTQIQELKWLDLRANLQEDLDDAAARFDTIYLLDDFMGTGLTFLRLTDQSEWKGKLVRFWEGVQQSPEAKECLAEAPAIRAHHYLGTARARDNAAAALAQAKEERQPWASDLRLSFGWILPADAQLERGDDHGFADFLERYYDPAIETEHFRVGGAVDARYGFGECGLTLVMEHNTPNNSLAIFWAESPVDGEGHSMRPLFRRRERHQ